MGLATLPVRPAPASGGRIAAGRLMVLARIACEEGATRAELARDLGCLIPRKLSAAELRSLIETELKTLAGDRLAAEARGRFKATPAGAALAAAELGCKTVPADWSEIRNIRLIAKALGIEHETASRLKMLARPDQLRAHVLAKAYGFKLRGAASPSRIRSALAVVALERAFGNKIKSGLGARSGLPAKTARLLAGQLLRRPRDAGTDSRLIAALAAEQAGASSTDAEALQLALLQAHFGSSFAAPVQTQDPDAAQQPMPHRERPAAANRPDLAGFVREVNGVARTRADGWPGNRKAFICHVWQAVADKHPHWGLSEIEFKAMLAEAHRTGHLVLAGADLKDKRYLKELQASAIAYKNMVWHFVRVED
jgi:hypothetical protein